MHDVKPDNRYLMVNGLRLHYLAWGNPEYPPMLLLHGFMSQAHVWDDFAALVSDHYRVLALDQRGHGESERAEDAAYTIDDHFTDIHHFVDTLTLDDLTIVGHSMGGRNALLYTACEPEKVKSLILVDARIGNNPQASQALKDHVVRIPLQAGSLDEVTRAVRILYPALDRNICSEMAKAGYRTTSKGTFVPKFDAKLTRLVEEARYLTEELWLFLAHVTCPTLVIRGKESPFVSREEIRRICTMMPRAESGEIPGATHMPAQENPRAFNRLMLDFLHKAG